MFYRPAEGHGLPHNPFNAIVSPRPIGWISTRAADGTDNLAPYSFFNAVAYVPPQVMFANTGSKPDQPRGKDTLANIEATGVFCVNVVSWPLRAAMNATSAALGREEDEFTLAGLERAPCSEIPCSRVAAAPAALECRLTELVGLRGRGNVAAFGEVVGIHIADHAIRDGRFDVTAVQPVARLGYRDFAVVREVFEMIRPDDA